jgi:hypothetical protein
MKVLKPGTRISPAISWKNEPAYELATRLTKTLRGFLHLLYTRAIRKGNPGELLIKQAIRKKLLYTKNTYILKLLHNAGTSGIEALVSGNTFLYACAKEVSRL